MEEKIDRQTVSQRPYIKEELMYEQYNVDLQLQAAACIKDINYKQFTVSDKEMEQITVEMDERTCCFAIHTLSSKLNRKHFYNKQNFIILNVDHKR